MAYSTCPTGGHKFDSCLGCACIGYLIYFHDCTGMQLNIYGYVPRNHTSSEVSVSI